ELVTAGNVQLLLVDMRMPGELSGLGVVAELRANPDLAGLRIVMVSASAKSELLDECELAGCDAFLTKPVDFDELDTTIHDVLAAP
ncbi:MAG: response regulator, partial [Thermoleophilia bacterium]|nr:response regulator [Thermoleophilia bacterium]